MRGWDPYQFILFNLALSFQATYAAPIIMLSQNRQARYRSHGRGERLPINVKAELEIELLHEKIDQLREREVLKLTEAVRMLTELLGSRVGCTRGRCGRRTAIITRGD
jgi:uncharacterized membrane protein